jgi:hypothetical protein
MLIRAIAAVALLASVTSLGNAACRDTTEGVRTRFVGTYAFTPMERRTIARIASETAAEVRRHLPALPAQLTLHVDSGKDVIPELGATATPMPPDWVAWIVDPDRPEGVVKIAEAHLRGALFHEFHHLVRLNAMKVTTLMDSVVLEGLATAFERDFAGMSYPWGQYPADAAQWVDELMTLPPETNTGDWLAKTRPDGRRWIGYKAGTYLADRAMKQMNRTSAELATTPTDVILSAR